MLRLTLDIVPNGDESRTRTLATVTIANVTGPVEDGTPCDYEVRGERSGNGKCDYEVRGERSGNGKWDSERNTAVVRGFTRGRHATELAAAALRALGWDGEE